MSYRVYMPLLAALVVAGTMPAEAQQESQQGQQQSDQKLTQEKASGTGAPLYISPAGVRQIQQALNKQGFDVGSVDGNWGESTSKAAANYQRTKKIEPTGSLTVELITSLGLTDLIRSQGQAGGQQQGQSDQKIAQENAQAEGAQLFASPATVRQIQQALNKKGYNAGNVQGTWDKGTSEAMRNFQQANGLEPTGNLNISSMSKLGIARDLNQLAQAGGGQAQQQGGAAAGQTGGGQQAQQSGQDMKWTQESAVNKGTPIHVSPADLRQIEQALNTQGYDAGNVDGNWDKQVQSALRNYQQAKGLEPTGNVNIRTISSLGLAQKLTDQGGGSQQAAGQSGQSGVQQGGAAAGQTGGGQQQSGSQQQPDQQQTGQQQ